MALLDDVKKALRISEATTDFDGEIQDLIDAAKADLGLSGVMSEKVIDTDPLIKRAVVTYCKANFGYDNPEAERFQRAYDLIKTHLSLSVDYAWFTITFTVTGGGVPIDGATITIGDDELTTNSLGVATHTVNESGIDVDYTVAADGYETAEGTVYVDGDKDVEVVLVEA
ncbi:head-tail connector protein [Desulfoscipio geothermicus]|uniref:Uncharacterized phage protein (Possible DNA packaging) n=1 Tax=Desulfoscipio geothermicus DSM 3669 TaxID=1121426 RepID=A0A1I6EC11_9FIRM|nr:uncharacterized phage protein (possible DNA packaging) [Desulfoscipio geothermicus DSM 3669]